LSSLANHFAEAKTAGEFARGYLDYLSALLAQLDVNVIQQIIDIFIKASDQDNTIYFIGNGGSAATASHFASDMLLNTRAPGYKPLKAVSLVDNVAITTALANDDDYGHIFLRQLELILHPHDVLVALSVSGNSANVVKAVQYAQEMGVVTIGCTGFDGGILRDIVDVNLHVPTVPGEYGPVEDIAMILDHLIYSYIRLARRGHL